MELILKVVLAAILLSLAVCVYLGRRNPENMKIKPIIILLLCGAVALAGVQIYITFFTGVTIGQDGVLRLSSFEGSAGYKFGRSIADDFPDGGKVVIIRRRTSDKWMNQQWDARISGLKEGFGEVDLKVVEYDPPDAGAELDFDKEAQARIKGLISEHPDAVAAVSFEPFFGNLDTAKIGTKIPTLYLKVSVRSDQWKDLMRKGIVGAAIVVKEFADHKSAPPDGASADEIFRMRYKLIRKNDLD